MPTERRTAPLRVPGRKPKSGARALARHLAAGTLDRRTGIARDFYAVQDGLAADRGGWGNTTTAEKILMEVAAAELVFLRSIFAWAARQPSIIEETADGPRLLGPLAKGFTSHAGALTRALGALGMRPDALPIDGQKCGRCGSPYSGDYLAHLRGCTDAAPIPADAATGLQRSDSPILVDNPPSATTPAETTE
ncbi:MAG: hypothetical protein ABI629_07945 [bacterium]